MEETKWLKPSVSVSRTGDSASVQAVTRVNAEQASKRTMRRPTRRPFRGRLIRLGVLFALLHPAVSAFPERVVGSACALSFSRLARRSLALRPAHSRCHQFVTR